MAQKTFRYSFFRRIDRRRRDGYHRNVYPSRYQRHRYAYLLQDWNNEAKTKTEKNFIRKYSRKHRNKLHARDKWKCRGCETKDKFLHIHHIRYTCDMNDWISLCKNCHDLLHSREDIVTKLIAQDLSVQDILRQLFETLDPMEKNISEQKDNQFPQKAQSGYEQMLQ